MPSTVLLVEDEPDLMNVMAIALGRAGFHVVTAETGNAAVAALAVQRHVDAVVMDRGLPDMDGTEAASIMRAGGFRGAILIASGYTGAVHVDACRSAGVDGVLAKPFTLADLVDRVNNAVTAGAATPAPASPAA